MSRKIQLLDCTLRDGGYINDWEFGHHKLVSIYERLVAAGVDIIEVGFLDDRRPFDKNRSIFPDTSSVAKIYGSVVSPKVMTVGMIDYGTCSLDNIEDEQNSALDGIRVIFKKHLMQEAMDYCAQIKKKGYKVFAQMVSVADYEDEDIRDVVKLANEVKPYALSMVDTYGLLYPDDVSSLFEKFDALLDKDINIGFHAHNNLQLGYADAISFINTKSDRNIVVDGTLFGMGKSAGNDPLELVAPYLNEHYDMHYDVNPMLEAIEESIKDIFAVYPWGYRTQFYMSAENLCHPNYVAFLMSRDNISVSDMNIILSRIEPGKKRLFYDREYIDALHRSYIEETVDDKSADKRLKEALEGRSILIVGPGKNIKLQEKQVMSFIDKENPVKISINYIPNNIEVDYVFITKLNRYMEMTDALSEAGDKIKLITTSNVKTREKADLVYDRGLLLERKDEIMDNSFLMLLKIFKRAGINAINCAGLDGYSDREDNYFERDMEYEFIRNQARSLNFHIREVLTTEYRDMDINFITYSHYMESGLY